MPVRLAGFLALVVAAPLLAQQEGPAGAPAPPEAAPPLMQQPAAEEPGATQAPEPGTTAQSTEVRGTVPDLAGRWLVALRLGTTADNPAILTLRFWDVTGSSGAARVEDRSVRLPPAMAERQKQAGAAWTPTPADLRELAGAWRDLPAEARGIATVKTEMDDRGHFDDLLREEDVTRDAAWALRQTVTFRPGGGRPAREFVVLGVETPTPTGFKGKAALVMLAMAPFPVPIALRGRVDMYRLEEPRGLVARMLDVFSGCGRQP